MARNPDAVQIAIAEQAAEWMVRLDEDEDLASRQALVTWLTQSAMHTEEFLLTRAACRALRDIDPHREIETPALASLQAPLIPLTGPGARSDGGEPAKAIEGGASARIWPRNRGQRGFLPSIRITVLLGWALAASLLAAVIWPPLSLTASPATYTTSIGEQRSITLEDGSLIQLNTQSRVDVSYSRRSRDIRLLQGEALFQVTHDALRPFRVQTDTIIAEAVGTQFDVYRRPADTVVSVIEGQVRLFRTTSSLQSQSSTESLKAGDNATINVDGKVLKRRSALTKSASLPSEIAWTAGEISFDNITVADAVAEFNRYNTLQIELIDPVIAGIRVGGIFRSHSPETFVKVLEKSFGVVELPVEPGKHVLRLARRTQ